MSCLEIDLAQISLELIGTPAGESSSAECVDCDVPLVVTTAGDERYLLVDGLKRFFALRAEGHARVWVVVKDWTKEEARLARLRLNSPRRKTSLREELDTIERLTREDGLSPQAIARGLNRKTSWVERRLWIADRVEREAIDVLPERLFATSFLDELASLPSSEQIATVGALDSARFSLRDATRFLRLLSTQDSDERASSRADPKGALDRLDVRDDDSPTDPTQQALQALQAAGRALDRALEHARSLPSRLLHPILRALLQKIHQALEGFSRGGVPSGPVALEPLESSQSLSGDCLHDPGRSPKTCT
jgi:ParB-like chromosome segregation protein Spo0J